MVKVRVTVRLRLEYVAYVQWPDCVSNVQEEPLKINMT